MTATPRRLDFTPLEDRTTPARLVLVSPAAVGATTELTVGTAATTSRTEAVPASAVNAGVAQRLASVTQQGYTASTGLTTSAETGRLSIALDPFTAVNPNVEARSVLTSGTASSLADTSYGDFVTVRIDPTSGERTGDPVRVVLTGAVVTTSRGVAYSGVQGLTQFRALYDPGSGTKALLQRDIDIARLNAGEPADATSTATFDTKIGETFQIALLANQRLTNTPAPLTGSFQSTAELKLDMIATPLANTRRFAVGADAGRPGDVAVYEQGGKLVSQIQPFGTAYNAGVRVAVADFNRDGTADLVTGAGPGTAPLVRVFDGKSLQQIFEVQPFESTFTGGVYVAAGDVTGDSVPDVIVTPDQGGGPRVRVYGGVNFAQVADFLGIDDPNFRGGARPAVGDVSGDGVGDLIVAAGFQGGPRVAGYDGRSLGTGKPAQVFADFFAFEQTLRNGVYVASGDLDGDGFAEVVVGGGPGGGPRVTAFSGKALAQRTGPVPLVNLFAGNPDNRGGVRVAVRDLDGDGKADLITGDGPGGGARVISYPGSTITSAGPPQGFSFDAFPGATTGVFVG